MKTKTSNQFVFTSRACLHKDYWSLRGTRKFRGELVHYEMTIDVSDKDNMRKEILRAKRRIQDELGRYGTKLEIKDRDRKQLIARAKDMTNRGYSFETINRRTDNFGIYYAVILEYLGILNNNNQQE